MRTARVEVFRVEGIFSLSLSLDVKGNVTWLQPKKTQKTQVLVTPGLGSMYSHKSTTTWARGAQTESDSARGVGQGTQYQEPVAVLSSLRVAA